MLAKYRYDNQSQSSPGPAGKDSSPILTEAGTSVRLSFQSRSLLLLADESSGVTEALQRLQSASSWLVSGVCRLCLTDERSVHGWWCVLDVLELSTHGQTSNAIYLTL